MKTYAENITQSSEKLEHTSSTILNSWVRKWSLVANCKQQPCRGAEAVIGLGGGGQKNIRAVD